ncbi:DUF6266 family protein [Pedobacter aquatilis]|uniref:DUF6266 family protein n=1 Tax=Pedobacter aquatilis TaxID=351343 RepID=UPI002930A725|nr:DUF6266 family protein [Pedobacter aquatilis]
MGTFKNGILGGFFGKVGPVVGLQLGDTYVMRALPRRTKPFTAKELENQHKFRLVQNYLSPFIDLLKVGFNNYYTKTGGFRAAVSYTRKEALKKGENGFYIDQHLVKISGGALTPAIDPLVEIAGNGEISIQWNTTTVNRFDESDQLLLLVYNSEQKIFTHRIFNGAYRKDGQIKVTPNPRLLNMEVDIYIGFVAADRSMQSDSQYLGRFKL